MKRGVIFLVGVAIFSISISYSSPDPYTILQTAVKKLVKEPRVQTKVTLTSDIPGKEAAGSLDLQSAGKGENVSAKAHFTGAAQGVELTGNVAVKYIHHLLYFSAQLPMAPKELLGTWFALDSPDFKNFISRSNGRRLYSALMMLDAAAAVGSFEDNGLETQNKISMRRMTLEIDPNELMQIPFLHVDSKEGPPLSKESLKPFSNLPIVPIEFWVGAADNRLYRIHVHVINVGTADMAFNYRVKITPDLFKSEPNAVDARCLGLTFPEQLYDLLPDKNTFKKRTVQEIPGTQIDLIPADPSFKKPALDGLKKYLNVNNLTNVQILPLKNASDETLDALVKETKKEFPDQKIDDPGRFLIYIIPTQDGSASAVIQGNRALLHLPSGYANIASADAWVMRTLGKMYWKFPASTIPFDFMYGDDDDFGNLFRNYRNPKREFYVDESAPLLDEAQSDETQGQWEAAKTALAKAVQLNPINAKAYLELAQIEFRLAQYPEAKDSLDKALLLNPYAQEAYALLGKTDEKLNRPAAASREYKAAEFLKR